MAYARLVSFWGFRLPPISQITDSHQVWLYVGPGNQSHHLSHGIISAAFGHIFSVLDRFHTAKTLASKSLIVDQDLELLVLLPLPPSLREKRRAHTRAALLSQ